MRKHDYTYKEYVAHVLPCLFYGVFCGTVVGIFIFFFKYCAMLLEKLSRALYEAAKTSPLYIALLFVGLIAIAFAMAFLHKMMPRVSGGGIPRSEGILRGTLTMRWIRTIIGTLLGSFMSFLCGLPLGSEGPSVLMGTALGRMCGRAVGKGSAWDRYIMTGGAGAGFAVATGAPLSAILFTLEEIHKRFTPMLILSVSSTVVAASCVSGLLSELFGLSIDLFEFTVSARFSFSDVGHLILFSIIIAICVGIFNLGIARFGRLVEKAKRKLPTWAIFAILFVLTGVFGLLFSDAIYSGHHVITETALRPESSGYILALLVCRFFFMLAVTGSGATGGIFIPTLAIGALCGGLCGKLVVAMGMNEAYFPALVFLGMCAFLGGALRAPLTASVLFLELSAAFTGMFYVVLVVFSVYLITELFNQKPFYDKVLEGMEKKQNKDKIASIVRFEMRISHGSFVVGKAVRDILWPASSVVLSVTRNGDSERDMDHDGEKKLYPGDTVVLQAKLYDADEVLQELEGLVGRDFEIRSKVIQG